MKKVTALVAILFAAQLAAQAVQAKTVCIINTGDGNKMEFDQTLYRDEVVGSKMLLVRKDLGAIREYKLGESITPEQLNSLKGSILVSFSEQMGGMFGIHVSGFDLSNKARNQNATQTEALAIGTITEAQPLALILPKKNLSLTCMVTR